MKNITNTSKHFLIFIALLIPLILLIILLNISKFVIDINKHNANSTSSITSDASNKLAGNGLNKIQSGEMFEKYKRNTYFRNQYPNNELVDKSLNTSPSFASDQLSTGKVTRSSDTNVQVKGIDEPDFVKNNGENIIVNINKYLYSRGYESLFYDKIYAPFQNDQKTYLIKSLPADKMKEVSKMIGGGDMLINNNRLIIQQKKTSLDESDKILGIDISKSKFEKIWELNIDKDQNINISRLIEDKLFVIVSRNISNSPCIMPLLTKNGITENIVCNDFIYFDKLNNADQVTTVLKIDISNGKLLEKNTILTNSSYIAFIYQNYNKLYIPYYTNLSEYDRIKLFLNQTSRYQEIKKQIDELEIYDISVYSKEYELQRRITQYLTNNSDTAKSFTSDYRVFLLNNINSIDYTSLIVIDNSDLNTISTLKVPGTLLNQFSIDEYNSIVRIATTIDYSRVYSNLVSLFNKSIDQSKPNSDSGIISFDSDSNQISFIRDLGKGERIYSVRFDTEYAYLVTFRQTDPFYIVNLVDPKNPRKEGELKIPGFSSYLEKLNDKYVVGVGSENGQLKISIFNISNKKNPFETDVFKSKSWGGFNYDHKAFLHDEKYKLLVIFGYDSSYIFKYDDSGKLNLVKEVSNTYATRSIYINDNLYLISDKKIIAISEKNYEIVGEFNFN